jgi:hypothetical protein
MTTVLTTRSIPQEIIDLTGDDNDCSSPRGTFETLCVPAIQTERPAKRQRVTGPRHEPPSFEIYLGRQVNPIIIQHVRELPADEVDVTRIATEVETGLPFGTEQERLTRLARFYAASATMNPYAMSTLVAEEYSPYRFWIR